MMIISDKKYWAIMGKLANIELSVVPSPAELDFDSRIIFWSNAPYDEGTLPITLVVGRLELSRLLESQEWKTFLRYFHQEFGALGEGAYSRSLLRTILTESETETNKCPPPNEDFGYWDEPQ